MLLLLFGAKRIPEIAGSFGKGIKEFKKNMNEVQSADRCATPSSRAAAGFVPVREETSPPAQEPKRLI